MADYIDRIALMEDVDASVVFSGRGASAELRGARKIIDRILRAPAADVRPVVRGEWKEKEDCVCKWTECSVYGGFPPFDGSLAGSRYRSNFCPYCGADMRGEADDERSGARDDRSKSGV